jgi:VanZ family protein
MQSSVQEPSQRYRVVWRWALLGGYAACIFALSSIPGQALPSVRVSDKLIHTGEFGLLGLLICRALTAQLPTWPRSRIALLSLLGALFYGATDEVHQLFVPARSAELADVAADGVGVMLAVWGWLKLGAHWTWLR